MPTPSAHGPDISHYQRLIGPFDPAWQLGTTKCSEGAWSGDATFADHIAWCSPARWRGGYHWLRADSPIELQAANVVARIRRATGVHDLPIGWLVQTDWETTPGVPVPTSDMVIEFNDRVQQAFGRECVITYSSDWLPDSTLDADSRREFDEWRSARPADPLWFANYNTGTGSTGGWAECAKYGADVWQWTSSYQHPSIASRFDMNHVFNPAVLDRITGRTTITPPPQEDDMQSRIPNEVAYDSRVDGAAPKSLHEVRFMASKVGVNIQIIPAAGAPGFAFVWGAGHRPAASDLVWAKDGIGCAYVPVTLEPGTGALHIESSVPCHVIVNWREFA